jgi:CDGSH-type Zn-finger protein
MSDTPLIPVIAGLRSVKLETVPGTYFWCACGRSSKQPFCDGSHRGTGFQPLPVTIDATKMVKWCTCKHTKTPPYCDHSHRNLPGYEAKEPSATD